MLTKFTIIIPTRERGEPLHFCIKNLLKQDYENFEILVSDNNSKDKTAQIVFAFQDKRIRYVNTGIRVGMAHNWEFALSHVNDGWVLFVGDDDGLLPCALRTLDAVIKATDCEALTTVNCNYWWPLHFSSMPEGRLTIPLPVESPYEMKNSAIMLDRVLRGKAAYSELPWLYNGGASSVALLRRLSTGGRYFNSRNPDIYSAISLALGTLTYPSINVPIAINGASKFSSGTSYMLGQKNDPDSPSSLMMGESNIPFHSALIVGKSLQIHVYESYLQAAHLYNEPSCTLLEQLNLALKLADKSYFQETVEECLLMARQNGVTIPSSIKIAISRISNQFFGLVRRIGQRRVIAIPAVKLNALDVDTASDAAKYLYGVFDYFFCYSPFTRMNLSIFAFFISLNRYLRRIFKRE